MSICVQLTDSYSLLMDTGSGGEVVRNLDRAGVPLNTIQDIFISHRHSDHIGGLELLLLHTGLRAMEQGGNGGFVSVRAHHTVLETGIVCLQHMASAVPQIYGLIDRDLFWRDLSPGDPVNLRDDLQLAAFTVDHEPRDGSALGCLVTIARSDGGHYRMFYSGDTAPTPHLLRFAQGADVIIHEASGLDADGDSAHRVGHSTAGEAGRLAKAAGASVLFLVHIRDDNQVARAIEEAQQYFTGPVFAPCDLDSFALPLAASGSTRQTAGAART